uniref:TROVE domain-containing protein n=1 Tax=Pygocentrus nattereri TaxID=42514 RepID=A0AAR2L1V2_PYGNA
MERMSQWSCFNVHPTLLIFHSHLQMLLTHPSLKPLICVAVYTRQELNIRITANFLLALAAHLPESKPHLRRYFGAAVQLPSDWLEVTRIYSVVSWGCFSSSLPSCLKKALVDKFKQFSEYQLAKYNTRKHRCKHNKKKRKVEMEMSKRRVVDKKQKEFNMKKLIKHLHIKQPAEMVMSILGKRYPADLRAFVRSGLSGVWQSERAGQRMKLKQLNTWETRLSLEGNNAAVWEKLIDDNSLPFMAMLRNLRNMITQGISDKHHERILKRLTSKNAVIQSRQFPFRFLSAYKVILELNRFGKPSYSVRVSLLKVKKYTPELLERYRQALEKAVQISCRYNVPPLSGRTLIVFTNNWMVGREWKGAEDICMPPGVSDSTDNTSLSASVRYRHLYIAVFSFAQVDNIMMLNDCYTDWFVSEEIKKYRKETSNDPLLVNILLRGFRNRFGVVARVLRKSSVVRFISERGSSRLLDHLEQIDKLHNIPPPAGGAAKPKRAADIVPLPAAPKLRWRGVRVFISSTFRDMHAERDVLVRSVFPELRRRVAPHCLYLQEVELRWGVTEEESNQATQLCLSEVCRSQLLLGILGERYGQVPSQPTLPNLPQHNWVKNRTRIAVHSVLACCFSGFSSVPAAWRGDFVSESSESAAKMNEMKRWIRNNQFKITENYPCEWGGVVDGRPYVKGLEDFARAVMEDLWAALQKLYVEVRIRIHTMSENTFFLFERLSKVQECQQKGGILLVEGAHGEGKTAFMVKCLCKASEHVFVCVLCYRDLLSEFLSRITEPRKGHALALLVDGADLVHDARGQGVSEWIPERLPKGFCLILSVTKYSALQTTIRKKKGSAVFPLGQLPLPDRREIVQKELSVYGKKLSDSAFNNQVRLRDPSSHCINSKCSKYRLQHVFLFASVASDTADEERSRESALPALGLRGAQELRLL